MNPLLVKFLGGVGMVAALAFGLHWYNSYQQGIGYARAVGEYTQAENVKLAEQIAHSNELAAKLKKGTEEGEQRAKELETLRNSARVESGRLRNTIAELRGRMSELPAEACRAVASRGLELLNRCQERYLYVAGRAEGHAEYIRTLKDVWPEGD